MEEAAIYDRALSVLEIVTIVPEPRTGLLVGLAGLALIVAAFRAAALDLGP